MKRFIGLLLSLEHTCGLPFFQRGLISHFQPVDGTGWGLLVLLEASSYLCGV